MLSNHFAAAGLTAAFTALLAGAASAQNLAPYYDATITARYYDTQLGVVDFAQGTGNARNTTGSLSLTRTNFQVDAATSSAHGATIQADILAAPPSTPGGYALDLEAQSTATYYFTVDGPVGQTIGVFVSAKGTISWSQGAYAHAGFGVTDYNSGGFLINTQINYNDIGNDELKGTSMFADDEELFLTGGATYGVNMSAYVIYHSNQYLGAPDGSFPYSEDHAVVDPTFTIDANYADANLFTLDADGGPLASAPGGVPEPATWALMLGGFGMVGGAMRSRRKPTISFG